MAARNFILFLSLAVCLAAPAAAQRRVSASAQVQTVMDGKVTTVTKEVYCSANGRLVTVFHSPELAYIISNPKGEVQIYRPSAKEVISEVKEDFSDRDDLLYLFLTGRVDDMGLAGYGYKLVSSKQEEGGIIRDEPDRFGVNRRDLFQIAQKYGFMVPYKRRNPDTIQRFPANRIGLCLSNHPFFISDDQPHSR